MSDKVTIWFCEDCLESGTTEHDPHVDMMGGIFAVQDHHKERSPSCVWNLYKVRILAHAMKDLASIQGGDNGDLAADCEHYSQHSYSMPGWTCYRTKDGQECCITENVKRCPFCATDVAAPLLTEAGEPLGTKESK